MIADGNYRSEHTKLFFIWRNIESETMNMLFLCVVGALFAAVFDFEGASKVRFYAYCFVQPQTQNRRETSRERRQMGSIPVHRHWRGQ